MKQSELLRHTVALYHKHGWQLQRALLTPATQHELNEPLAVPVREHEIDALWFARSSYEGREAWELRWINPTPYALFETFEPDESEEDRADARRDTEARLRAHAQGN